MGYVRVVCPYMFCGGERGAFQDVRRVNTEYGQCPSVVCVCVCVCGVCVRNRVGLGRGESIVGIVNRVYGRIGLRFLSEDQPWSKARMK